MVAAMASRAVTTAAAAFQGCSQQAGEGRVAQELSQMASFGSYNAEFQLKRAQHGLHSSSAPASVFTT